MYQGTLRLFLASLVVYVHFTPGIAASGYIAVFTFYVISGYLITRVVATRYANGPDGLRRFALNRAIRLMPVYWLVLIFALGVTALFPIAASTVEPQLFSPRSWAELLPQLTSLGTRPFDIFTIFGWGAAPDDPLRSLVIPTAKTLSVEIVFYVLIAVALARHKRLSTGLWVASVIFAFVTSVQDNYDRGYETYIGASTAFLTGAMIFHHRDAIRNGLLRINIRPTLGTALAAITALAAFALWQDAAYIGLRVLGWEKEAANAILPLNRIWIPYAALPLSAFALWATIEPRPKPGHWLTDNRMAHVNDMAGDLSYPIFLIHYPAGAFTLGMTNWLLPNTPASSMGSPVWLALTLIVTVAMSVFAVFVVERPLGRLRAKIRQPATAPAGVHRPTGAET